MFRYDISWNPLTNTVRIEPPEKIKPNFQKIGSFNYKALHDFESNRDKINERVIHLLKTVGVFDLNDVTVVFNERGGQEQVVKQGRKTQPAPSLGIPVSEDVTVAEAESGDALEEPDGPEDEDEEPEHKVTKAELKTALDSAEVPYTSKATLAELQELADQHQVTLPGREA